MSGPWPRRVEPAGEGDAADPGPGPPHADPPRADASPSEPSPSDPPRHDPWPADAGPVAQTSGVRPPAPRRSARRPGPEGWTATSTLMAAAATILSYPLLAEGWRLGGGWEAMVLAACIGILTGGLWRPAFMLVLGGGAALLVHRGLLADLPADAPLWPPVLVAALAGLVVLCVWRVLAVAMVVVAALVAVRLTWEGVAPSMILDAIRAHL